MKCLPWMQGWCQTVMTFRLSYEQTNMDVVSPSERLSNQVYMYDRKENSIEMVTRNKLDIIPQESKNISYEKNIKPEI